MAVDLESLVAQAVAGGYGSIHIDTYRDGSASCQFVSRDSRRRSVPVDLSGAEYAAFAEEMHSRMVIHERRVAASSIAGDLVVTGRGELRETGRARQEAIDGAIRLGAVVAAAQMRVQEGSGARHWVLNLGFSSGAQVYAWTRGRLEIVGDYIIRGGSKDSPLFHELEAALREREDLRGFNLDEWLAARGAGNAIKSRAAAEAEAQAYRAARERRLRDTPSGTADFNEEDLGCGFIVRIAPDDQLRVITAVRRDGRVEVSPTGRVLDSVPVEARAVTRVVVPMNHRAFNARFRDRGEFDQVIEMCGIVERIAAAGRWREGRAAALALRELYEDLRYGPER